VPSSLQIDTRELSAALRQYKELSHSSLPQIINRKVLFILRRALARTPVADRGKIEAEFAVQGARIGIDKKTGRYKKRGNIYADSGASNLAERIIQARRIRAGQQPLSQGELRIAARKLVANRLRAVHALQAGWSRVIRQFAAAVRDGAAALGLPRVKHPGQGTLARNGPNPEATFEYDMVTTRHLAGGFSGQAQIDPRVAAALEQAISEETASLQEEIARRLQEHANKFNAPR
jgi:hypothetical protein